MYILYIMWTNITITDFKVQKKKFTKFSLLMLNMFTLWGTYACTFLVCFLFFDIFSVLFTF